MEETKDSSWARILVASEGEARERLRWIQRQVEPGGVAARVVRGERCVTKELLFEEWSTALDFPEYFGRNWDALDEVLSDMMVLNFGGLGSYWNDGPGIDQARMLIVLVSNAACLLRDESPRDLKILVEVLGRASLGSGFAQVLGENPELATLRVMFQCELETADALLGRLHEAGVDPVRQDL